MHGEYRLQFGSLTHGHLQCSKSAPRDSEHPDISVRPWLMCQPRNDLLSICLLLFGVLTLRRNALARAEPANVHPHAHVPAPREISMFRIISRRRPIIFPIGEIFEQGGELLAIFRPVRHVKSSGEAYTIFHRNPCIHHVDAVGWWRWTLDREEKQRGYEKEADDPKRLAQRGLRACTRADDPESV